MKKILFLLLLIYNTSHSQNLFQGKVYYKASLIKQKKSNKKMTNEVKDIIENSTDADFVLYFNKTASEYKEIKKMNLEVEASVNLTQVLGGGSDIYFTTTESSVKPFFKKERGGDVLLINYEKTKWDLTQESKMIGKYKCFKAIDINIDNKISYKHTEVWYTPSIPVSFGPKNFHGLPGLVLQVNTSSFLLNAYKINLNSKEVVKIIKPLEGIKISKEEYYKKTSAFFKKKN